MYSVVSVCVCVITTFRSFTLIPSPSLFQFSWLCEYFSFHKFKQWIQDVFHIKTDLQSTLSIMNEKAACYIHRVQPSRKWSSNIQIEEREEKHFFGRRTRHFFGKHHFTSLWQILVLTGELMMFFAAICCWWSRFSQAYGMIAMLNLLKIYKYSIIINIVQAAVDDASHFYTFKHFYLTTSWNGRQIYFLAIPSASGFPNKHGVTGYTFIFLSLSYLLWFWVSLSLDFIKSQPPEWLVGGVATATTKCTGWDDTWGGPLSGELWW